MNTEDRKHIDDLIAGRIIHIPQKLIDVFPRISPRKDGQEAAALMCHRIRMSEYQDRRNKKQSSGTTKKKKDGTAIHHEDWGFASYTTHKNFRKRLERYGIIKKTFNHSGGNHSMYLKTIERKNRVPYSLEYKSANDALSQFTQLGDLPCEYTREMLDKVDVNIEGAKQHLLELYQDYKNKPEKSVDEMDRDELLEFQNNKQKKPIEKIKDIDGLATPLRELINHRGKIHRGWSGKRLYSSLTQLKKTFRQFLTFNGEPLAGLDMSCAMPCLLGHITNDDHFIDDCLNDVFYDGIKDELKVSKDITFVECPIDRKQSKQIFMEYQFGHNRTTKTKGKDAYRVQQYIKKMYPKTFRYVFERKKEPRPVNKNKEPEYKKFSHLLQREESSIFVDGVLNEARLNGLYCLSIHDGIWTPQSQQADVFCIVKNVFEKLSIRAHFKDELTNRPIALSC